MRGQVALVTGASRGVGRGVARALHEAGATVYATGRSVLAADLPAEVIRIACDHTSDVETAAAFAKIAAERGRLDVLVNAAWGGYERMVEDGRFTWAARSTSSRSGAGTPWSARAPARPSSRARTPRGS